MFRNIYNTFANCFKIPELKSRILFTLGVLAIVPVDGLHRHSGRGRAALAAYIEFTIHKARRSAGDV